MVDDISIRKYQHLKKTSKNFWKHLRQIKNTLRNSYLCKDHQDHHHWVCESQFRSSEDRGRHSFLR